MKKILYVIILLLLWNIAYSHQWPKAKNDMKMEGERVWELFITAKGGRDKLQRISNVVENGTGNYYSGFKKIKSHDVDLIVLPDKWWSWADDRPSNFGLRMTMYNFETNKQYVVQFEGIASESALEPIEHNTD